jgi:hypothetical protein
MESPKLQHYCPAFRVRMLRQEIVQKPGTNIVISSEELSSLSWSYPKIRALLGLFPELEVHVIGYVREQAAFFNSYYLEILSDFVDPGPFEAFVEARLGERRYDYRHWFHIWDELVGSGLIVRPFDLRQLNAGDVVADFKYTVGLPSAPDSPKLAQENVAMNKLQAATLLHLIGETARSLGEAAQPLSTRIKLKRAAAKEILSLPELREGGRFWGFTPDLDRKVREQYRIPNSEFFGSHGQPQFAFETSNPRQNTGDFADLDERTRASIDERWRNIIASEFKNPG